VTDLRTTLWALPVPATDLDDVGFSDDGGTSTLRFRNHDGADPYQGGLAFRWPRAFRHLAESHCTEWHLEAYGELQEVEDSAWIRELVSVMRVRNTFEMHHYVIYLDSSGCYEVVAASWAALPDERSSEGSGR